MFRVPVLLYPLVKKLLEDNPINHFFARSVIEKHVKGEVWVDNSENPETAYILHPYGMGLLVGNCTNYAFNLAFYQYALNVDKQREKVEWLQAWPGQWNEVLSNLFSDKIKQASELMGLSDNDFIAQDIRVNFKFNRSIYQGLLRPVLQEEVAIIRTTVEIFTSMPGAVVPANFWNSANDFMAHGVGYSCLVNGTLAATAYSAFIHENYLELGIETVEAFRGKGLAQVVCMALIDYCLEKGFKPVWACRKGNTGSWLLAQKLGFEPVCEIPYYRLPV